MAAVYCMVFRQGSGPCALFSSRDFGVPPVTPGWRPVGDGDPATLRVYIAAISSCYARVDNDTVGCHRLMSHFLKGALWLRPPRAQRAPAWDLHLVLDALCYAWALRVYVAATASIRRSDQLFLCYGGPRRGCALSKQ